MRKIPTPTDPEWERLRYEFFGGAQVATAAESRGQPRGRAKTADGWHADIADWMGLLRYFPRFGPDSSKGLRKGLLEWIEREIENALGVFAAAGVKIPDGAASGPADQLVEFLRDNRVALFGHKSAQGHQTRFLAWRYAVKLVNLRTMLSPDYAREDVDHGTVIAMQCIGLMQTRQQLDALKRGLVERLLRDDAMQEKRKQGGGSNRIRSSNPEVRTIGEEYDRRAAAWNRRREGRRYSDEQFFRDYEGDLSREQLKKRLSVYRRLYLPFQRTVERAREGRSEFFSVAVESAVKPRLRVVSSPALPQKGRQA